MKLLPAHQTAAQRQALGRMAQYGRITLSEPCDCGSQIRHNNGGNYHSVTSFRMDAGTCWRNDTFTGDYAPPDDWQEVSFSAAIDEIARAAAAGWSVATD